MCASSKRKNQAWPTKAAMAQVYEQNLWGGSEGAFYSGEGSHDPKLVVPFLKAVSNFLSSFTDKLSFCDLGCGDFNIGKELVGYTKAYTAVDIVENLIAHNKENFKQEHLVFQCIDIALDELPDGDCALVRQVLQHLSNLEIQKVVQKLGKYKYIILTEHIPSGDFVPNKDIISGQGIRLKKQSGVQITAPPFNFQIKEERELLKVILDSGKGVVVTTLYTVY